MFELLSSNWALLACLFGLCVGSFLNVVIHRLPKMMEREWHAQCAELHGEVAEELPPLNLSKPARAAQTVVIRLARLKTYPYSAISFSGDVARLVARAFLFATL